MEFNTQKIVKYLNFESREYKRFGESKREWKMYKIKNMDQKARHKEKCKIRFNISRYLIHNSFIKLDTLEIIIIKNYLHK